MGCFLWLSDEESVRYTTYRVPCGDTTYIPDALLRYTTDHMLGLPYTVWYMAARLGLSTHDYLDQNQASYLSSE
jgi:hypothetical protein